MSELLKRVLVAVVGIPLAMLLIYAGGYYFSLAVIIIAILGVGEYIEIAKRKSNKVQAISTYGITIAVLLIFALNTKPELIAFYLLLTLILAFLIVYSVQIFKGIEGAIFSVSASLNIPIYLGFGFSSLIIIRNFNHFLLYWRDVFGQNSFLYSSQFADNEIWGLFLFFIFLTIWTCDSAAYFFGKSFGKRRLHPVVSPKKSWEGAIAGLLSSVIIFSLLNYFFIEEIPLYISLIAGLLIGTIGQIGDLAESQLKRDAGVKDSSNLLPGHGGILDRFDSVLFVFPTMVIYLFLIAFWGIV